MGLNSINMSVNPQEIHYSETELYRLIIREVYKDGIPTGVYHIKAKQNINHKFLVNFLKKNLSGVEVDLIDPECVMELEYPIYMISHISRGALISNFGDADVKLDEFMKDREKLGKTNKH